MQLSIWFSAKTEGVRPSSGVHSGWEVGGNLAIERTARFVVCGPSMGTAM